MNSKMLETDEVDIDYFTPDGSTSLASIFGKSSIADEAKDNQTLKYVPPPPPEKSKSEEAKPTQWIFTCAVHVFEWLNSKYISWGKLGLAILKVVKTNSHGIVIYDSNKTTVSYVTISPKLHIHMRDELTISYYDNVQKYWSIQISEGEINKLIQLLKDLQATIVSTSSQETDKEQIDSSKIYNEDDVTIKDTGYEDKRETDTEFSENQHTKDSILKRMANMGHSVLPPHGNSKACISDSSDSNDADDSKKKIRHKPIKLPPKRYTDPSIQEKDNIACHSRKLSHKIQIDEQVLVPSNTSTTLYGGEMNVFVSEQKISNSELRIHVNRVSDKLDVVLERLNDAINIDKNNSFSCFQNDIVQKLIKEYESKIKNYESILSSKGIDFHSLNSQIKTPINENDCENNKDNVACVPEIDVFIKKCKEKDTIITTLEREIRVLNENSAKMNEENKVKINKLLVEIQNLNENLTLESKEMATVQSNSDNINVNNQESCNIGNKVKKIMNDTFEAISVHFDDKVAYSGETIKAIIAKVIKKTTIQALQEL